MTSTAQRRPDSGRDERGAATVLGLIIVGIALVAIALVYDLGMAAVARSEVADAATSLARAGATEIQVGSAGSALDAREARDVISQLAAERWPHLGWDAVIGQQQVSVTVTASYDARFMGSFGWSGTDLEVTSSAGVEQ